MLHDSKHLPVPVMEPCCPVCTGDEHLPVPVQFDYLVREKIADGPLIAKWRKPGYEILCSMLAIQKGNHNFGTTSHCRCARKLLSTLLLVVGPVIMSFNATVLAAGCAMPLQFRNRLAHVTEGPPAVCCLSELHCSKGTTRQAPDAALPHSHCHSLPAVQCRLLTDAGCQ